MESFLLSDVHCFLCNNFLSVAPILIDTQGKNICGRCESNTSGGLFQHNIFYERLAHQFRFPCKFAKEGCPTKSFFHEVECHEELCPYQSVKCEVDSCVWRGIPVELITHYNKCHSDFTVEDHHFKKELVIGDGSCIMVTEGFYFLIKWSYSKLDIKLKVKCLHLLGLECGISFKYVLSLLSSEEIILTSGSVALNRSTTITLQDILKIKQSSAMSVLFSLQALLPVTAINKKIELLNTINCPYCSYQIKPPVLKCLVDHLTCVNCSDENYNFCKECNNETSFYRILHLEVLATSSVYKCKWEDCNEALSVREIESHEQICSKRIYKCPHCLEWKGLLNDVVAHDAVCICKEIPCPLLIDTELTVLGINIAELEYTLVAYKELFFVVFSPNDTGIEVNIGNCGPPSFFGWYRYEAFLQHTEDLNFPFNKKYIIENKCNNWYLLEVPNEYISNFGGSEFYKITVKIYLLTGGDRSQNVAKHFKSFKWTVRT